MSVVQTSEPLSAVPKAELPGGVIGARISREHAKTRIGQRVLIVALQGENHADGGTESLTQLVEHFENLRLTVLTNRETSKTCRWREAGHEVWVWPCASRANDHSKKSSFWSKLSSHLKWNLRLGFSLLNQRCTVAHLNDPHALWHSLPALTLLGIPTIYNIRDTKPSFTLRDQWKWRIALRMTTAQIMLSREMREFWHLKIGSDLRKLHWRYSIVDLVKMSPPNPATKTKLRYKLGLGDPFAIGYVASFSEKKAQLRFLQNGGHALKDILDSAKATIHFVGDFDAAKNPYCAACAAAVKQLGLEGRIRFHGFTDRIQDWYRALDLVVVATQNEGLARCMIESLACGTPVISFSVCSAREILEKHSCGVVVPSGDYSELFRAIRQLARDEATRKAYAHRARQMALQNFSAPGIVTGYESIYRLVGGTAVTL